MFLNSHDKLYSVDEIATMTSLTTRTIRTYLKNGILRGRKIGGQWRFTTEDIEKFMNHGEVESSMSKEMQAAIDSFVDGSESNEEETQICTIVDRYVEPHEAKATCDQLLALINGTEFEAPMNFKYDYIHAKKKARFVLFAAPGFIAEAMKVFQ